MRRKSVLVYCVVFLTCALVYADNAEQSAQQVELKLSNSSSGAINSTNSTLLPNGNADTVQSQASKVIAFIEGGTAKITPKPEPKSPVKTTPIAVNGNTSTNTLSSSSLPQIGTVMSRPYGREHMPVELSGNSLPDTFKALDVKPVVESSADKFPHNEEHRKQKVVGRKGVDDSMIIKKPTIINNTSSVSTAPVGSVDSQNKVTSTNNTSNSTTTNSTTTATTTNTSTTTTTTISKPIPKKPLVTMGNDDEPFAPSHFVSSKKNGSSRTVSNVPTWESYEYSKEKSSSSGYIVPIVGVILSVPLVSILLNFIYKRTKEWWHHRHYSRMDFLIDGMYNN